jgi:hypothetical protein
MWPSTQFPHSSQPNVGRFVQYSRRSVKSRTAGCLSTQLKKRVSRRRIAESRVTLNVRPIVSSVTVTSGR